MSGIEFEILIADNLTVRNIPFTQEGEKISYGHKSSKGKYDFDLENYAIEAKVVSNINKFTLPISISNGHVIFRKSPTVKTHQLKALRKSGKTNGLLIHESALNRNIWLNTVHLSELIALHGLKPSLVHYQKYLQYVELDNFFNLIKENNL